MSCKTGIPELSRGYTKMSTSQNTGGASRSTMNTRPTASALANKMNRMTLGGKAGCDVCQSRQMLRLLDENTKAYICNACVRTFCTVKNAVKLLKMGSTRCCVAMIRNEADEHKGCACNSRIATTKRVLLFEDEATGSALWGNVCQGGLHDKLFAHINKFSNTIVRNKKVRKYLLNIVDDVQR